jgi:carbonic anhydrase
MNQHLVSRTRQVFGPIVVAVGMGLWAHAFAAEPAATHAAEHASAAEPTAPGPAKSESQDGNEVKKKTAPVESLPTASANPMAEKIRAAMAGTVVASKKMTVVVESKDSSHEGAGATSARHSASPTSRALASRYYRQARAAAVAGHPGDDAPVVSATMAEVHNSGEVHWSYEGENGPQAWGKLKPDFNLCATGKRQSPINIEDGNTLQGPAEPVQFAYVASNATVVNNGHTIQVDVQGDNSITVRGSNYRLLQFHFHTPSEEQINFKRFPMVAHLVHKNNEGQLAVVAVLLEEGATNPLIDKVWTYMPLDSGDRVRMPPGLLDLTELLPTDQRYYQFMGSLTTPPCSEGVLWMVLKKPVSLSKAQYKLFTQLYPGNARPVQPINGRPVREAQ